MKLAALVTFNSWYFLETNDIPSCLVELNELQFSYKLHRDNFFCFQSIFLHAFLATPDRYEYGPTQYCRGRCFRLNAWWSTFMSSTQTWTSAIQQQVCTSQRTQEIGRIVLLKVWAPFQYKDRLSMHRDSHDKNETVTWPSHHYHGNSYSGKTVFLYWNDPLNSPFLTVVIALWWSPNATLYT